MTDESRGVAVTVAVAGADIEVGAALTVGLSDLGARVAPLPSSTLTGREDLRVALAEATRQLGSLDGVVLASVGPEPTVRCDLAGLDAQEWHTRVELPLHRTLVCFQGAFDALSDVGGTVVVLVPTLSLVGAAGFAPWAAVTEGQRALAKAAARVWGRRAITVQCVAVPAALLTTRRGVGHGADEQIDRPGQPAPALRQPDVRADVAAVVHGLLSPAWRAVTGSTVAVDGGVWMTP
jgi:NAD(P)-dependent dehydrogenase (short-subunit alcohol dehydrogenase family)